MNEIWKPCYLFESSYQVSSLGRVRNIGDHPKTPGGYMSLNRKDMYGHPMVHLQCNGFSRSFRVCKLVAIAFLGAKDGSRFHHKNGDITDCSAENIDVYDSKQDMPDSVRKLTHETAKKVFIYDPDTGVFLKRPKEITKGKSKPKVPYKTGYIKRCGNKRYLSLSYLGRNYFAHRVALLIVNGVWPEEVDHINGESLDNRLSNLREVTREQNSRNSMTKRDDGLSGVHFEKNANGKKKWYAYVGKLRSPKFMTKEEALFARDELRLKAGCGPSHGKRKTEGQ